jgi:predicted RNase H-like HicB family nuclease
VKTGTGITGIILPLFFGTPVQKVEKVFNVRQTFNFAKIGYEDMIMRQIVITRGEDSYWVVECPSLPGCISQGKTKDEAIANIKEAIRGYIQALEEDHIPVPEEHFETMVLAV